MGLFSNYCGPGGKGIPRHVTDTLCKLHDESEEYKHIVWAYTHFNGADEDFLKALADVIPENTEERLVKWGAETYFNLKKKFFPMGRSPGMRPAGKRSSTTTHEELVAERMAPNAKMRALMPPSYYEENDWDDESDYDDMPSLENWPSEETMALQRTGGGGDDAPMGIEGAETQIGAPHDVWKRFPNHQWAKLGWWYTNYITDIGGTIAQAQKNAFDNPDYETTTALLTTGGGVRIPVAGASTLSATGFAGYTPSGHDFKNPMMFQLRMTTPYNIMKTYTGQGIVGGNIGNSQPAWLEMFEGKYQYYHVNETEWRIDFNFGTPFFLGGGGTPTVVPNGKDIGYYIFWKYTSNDTPPLSFNLSNNNIANATAIPAASDGNKITVAPMTTGAYNQPCTPDDYFRMKGFNSKHVNLSTIGPTHVTIGGKYKFGQCKMDIKQQDHSTLGGTALQTEGWIQTGSTYLFPEDLTIIIVADNAMNSVGGIFTPVGYRMNTEMLTEFRDLRSAFKFPTPANAYINTTTTLNTEAAFFNKGAAYT